MAGKRRCFSVNQRKVYQTDELEQTNLKRCLNRWDLTALGVGSTLGVGMYVVVGYVTAHVAGPSIVLSFFIAAVAALFAGLCYAEFGARVPKAGAAYTYTYVAVGEFMAFLVGWTNILEGLFGTASVARGLSMFIDTMSNGTMSNWFGTFAAIDVPYMSTYFDFFAFLIVIVVGAILAFGVRGSAMANNVLAVLNMATVLFIIILGAFAADSNNWSLPLAGIPEAHGVGGFFPYGVWGTLKGAAICFYGFVGFDSISATGEEVREPRRVIPITLLIVILIAFISYTSVAIVTTMMVPYYLQDGVASVATAFTHVGWDWARWIISIGAVFGILSSLYGALFPLPRLLHAMATDGMLVHCLGKLTQNRSSPALATCVSAVIIALLASLLDLKQLLLMMCIGTLFSYTLVAVGVILLRYRSSYDPEISTGIVKQLFGLGAKLPTRCTSRIVTITVLLFILTTFALALVVNYVVSPLVPGLVLHFPILILLFIITVQPKCKEEISFKTPLVPVIPCLSIYVNIHLMILINYETWIRVGIWVLIGIPIYFVCMCCYKRKSNLKENINITHRNKNGGKPPVQIIVESPTPPDTINRSNYGGDQDNNENEIQQFETQDYAVRNDVPYKIEEITIHQAYIENNEEKEAKIIDLLDQVLQAEEDSYGEQISLKEHNDEDIISTVHETLVHRKSLSELSDAGSDASLGNQVLSKYDVIAQVHREDLPKVNEEEEKVEREEDIDNEELEDHEEVTAFNDSDTNSRTDESGYSDTIDRNAESLEESKEDIPYIPVPPPLPDNYFTSPNFKKSYSIASKHRTTTPRDAVEEENKPRESVTSNNSQSDDNLAFGSDRQIHFMSKLNNIFQTKITSNDEEEPRRRSQSTGNVVDNAELVAVSRERPSMFLDLQKEIISREAAQNLRPVNAEDKPEEEPEDVLEPSLSREDLKSKLENIFAAGGPQLLKPRLMKSNPPTPEESYQTDTSSTESIPKLPKMEKNDTLKRQKAKFSEVLNSFRLSMNKDDDNV